MDQSEFDSIVDDFDSTWRSGERPALEEYLDGAPEAVRNELLIALLQIELWWLREGTPPPDRTEYLGRFPAFAEAIKLAFTEFNARTLYDCMRSTDVCERAKQYRSGIGSTRGIGRRLERFGDYELLGEIARGGMGVVFKARQVTLDRIVALKMILSGELADENEIRRFQTEAESAGKLEHPGIVPVYEFGQHDCRHYFSMGFVDGSSLQQRVSGGPLDPKEAALICKKIANAVAYAHSKGVIHRDLKPGNVLIDPIGEPRITDFGLAKKIAADDQLTRTGAVLGTPNFMPPEQALGKTNEIDARSDLYALGAILYCLLTGHPPFQSSNVIDTVRQTIERDPVPPSRLNAAVSRDLETICLKCLEKNPDRRYQTAVNLEHELERFLEGRPILARPVSSPERLRRWCTRNPLVAALTALIFTFLVSSPFVAATQMRLRNDAEEISDHLADVNDALRKQKDELAATNDALLRRDYVNRLIIAKRDIDVGNSRAAKEVLVGCPPALRNWEWFRLEQLLDQSVVKIDCDSAAKFQPTGDLIAASLGNRVIVRNTEDMSVEFQLKLKTRRSISDLAWSPDGSAISTCGHDGLVNIWKLGDTETSRTRRAHESRVWNIAWSPSGKMIATAGEDKTICLWDLESNETKYLPVSHQISIFGHLSWHQNDRYLAFQSRRQIEIWDVTAEKLVKRLPAINVTAVAFSNDGKYLAYSRMDENTVEIWSLSEWKLAITFSAHPSTVTAIAWSPDDTQILTACQDSHGRIWNVSKGKLESELIGHESGIGTGIRDVSWSRHGDRVATTGIDRKTRIWEVGNSDQFEHPTFPGISHASVQGIAWNPDGRKFAVLRNDATVVTHSGEAFDTTKTFDLGDRFEGTGWSSQSISWSPAGQLAVAAGSQASTIDPDAGLVTPLPVDLGSKILEVAWSPVGDKILVTALGGGCAVIDAKTQELIREMQLSQSTGGWPSVAWHPHEDCFAVTSASKPGLRYEYEIRFIYLDGRPEPRPIKTGLELSAVRWSHNGKYIAASGMAEPTIRIWNVEEHKLVTEMRSHGVAARDLAWSPDDLRLASAGTDRTLKIWDPYRGTELLSLGIHESGITTVAWSPDGKTILTGDFRSNVKVSSIR